MWRRTILDVPGRPRDSTTAVTWLQTPHWHGDLRVPADRPSFTGCTSLADCTPTLLAALLRQQGFAGITTVEAVGGDEHCRWHRRLDYAVSTSADIGRMRFDADGCDEWGVEAAYYERWLPADDGAAPDTPWMAVVRGNPLAPHDVALRWGPWAMRLRGRDMPVTETRHVLAAIEAGEPVPAARLREAADFEISLARRDADGSDRIVRSTLPWLEGRPLDLPRHTDHALDTGWQQPGPQSSPSPEPDTGAFDAP